MSAAARAGKGAGDQKVAYHRTSGTLVSPADLANGMEHAQEEFERKAAVALDDITVARRKWNREHRRPRLLTAREALVALQFEALVTWTAAHNLAAGMGLTEADRDRLTIACKRIDTIVDEVTG